jgi:DNA modification methylase
MKNLEKRAAVLALLGQDTWRGKSDREIAREVGVSPTFVGKTRATVHRGQCDIRLGRDGRRTNVAGIGGKNNVVYLPTSRDASSNNPDLRCGDCLEVLKDVPDGSVNLIVTSPPYGKQRKKTYGGIDPDKYVEWFLPRAAEFFRVLAPDGSFVLNIKENVVNGERHPYVLDLVLALRKQGWLWTEEYIWHKSNCFPGKWPNRFRDGWEHLYHFTKNRRFKMNQDNVMVPKGDWAKVNRKLSEKFCRRTESATGSGFGRNHAAWNDRKLVNPDNVLRLAVESTNRGHSAAFPVAVPDWFIRLFTDPGDLVLDPFCGSGTTGVACRMHDRRFMGIDIHENHCDLALERWTDAGRVEKGKVSA